MTAQKRLTFSFYITLGILAAELAGGLISNSLALLSDAGHVFTDAFALGLSMLAVWMGRKPSGLRATFGYQRVGLLVAVVNGLSLVGIALFIFIESYRRFIAPPIIDLAVMMPVAAGGLAANVVMALILGREHKDLNIKSAWLHVMGDTLSSVGVIISGAVIYFTGRLYADAIAGFLIGLIIITGGARVAKEAIHIFLELVPKGFHVEDIAKEIAAMSEVMGIHDVHIWSLSHGKVAFTAHVWVHDQMLGGADKIRKKIEARLNELGISHTLIQLECGECEKNGLYCQIHLESGDNH